MSGTAHAGSEKQDPAYVLCHLSNSPKGLCHRFQSNSSKGLCHRWHRALALSVLVIISSSASDLSAQQSPTIAAMHDELQRSMADLRMKGEPAPYYIAYEVLDRTIADFSGRLGALVENPPRRARTLRVEVRVGDYDFDSSRFVIQGFGGAALTGETAMAPIDDDYDAMRREIWLATDTAYKRAVNMFARKKAAFQNRTASDPTPDFSKHAAVETVLPLITPPDAADRRAAAARVQQASAVFASHKDVDLSEAVLTHVHGTRYYLNSEGTKTVAPIEIAALTMYAEAQAGDGMPVRQTFNAVERTIADLPSPADLVARAKELSTRVTAARAAPIGDDFAGAVLVEGAGSAQFIALTLVPMMQARRPPDTENPRMVQGTSSPFLNRTGLRVMADAFVVRDTPSLKQFEGKPTAGSYVVDDEGVRAKDVTLVDKGRLVTLLTSRTPHKQFPQSNGHGRSGTVLAGVFQVESTQAIRAAEMKQKYLALLKAQDKSFGYIVRAVRPEGQAGDGGPGIDDIVKVTLDGHETPVRGMRFGNVAPTAFRDIAEASTERHMYSYRAGATSAVSVIAPSLIFEELEIQRVRDILQTPPVVPSPLR